jgi:hypothetical protein
MRDAAQTSTPSETLTRTRDFPLHQARPKLRASAQQPCAR